MGRWRITGNYETYEQLAAEVARLAAQKLPLRVIGERVGVSRSTAWQVIRRNAREPVRQVTRDQKVREVLRLTALGMTYKEVAAAVGISPSTAFKMFQNSGNQEDRRHV